MYKTYHYEIPLPEGGVCSPEFGMIEDCVEDCKRVCHELGVDYDDRAVKLFITDADGVVECTEEGEFAD